MTKNNKENSNQKTKSKLNKLLCFLVSILFAFVPLIIYLILRKKKKQSDIETKIQNFSKENLVQNQVLSTSKSNRLATESNVDAKSGANLLARFNEHIKIQEQKLKAEEEKKRLAFEEAKLKSEEEIGSMYRDLAKKSQEDSETTNTPLKLTFSEINKLNQNEQSRVLVVYIKKLNKITNNLITKSINVNEASLIKKNMKNVYTYYDQLCKSDKTIREIAIEILFLLEEFKRSVKKFILALKIDKNLENSPLTAAYYKNPLTNKNERVSQALSFVIFKNHFVSFVPYENYIFAISIIKNYCEWDEYVKEKLNQNIKIFVNKVVSNTKNAIFEIVSKSDNIIQKKKNKRRKNS